MLDKPEVMLPINYCLFYEYICFNDDWQNYTAFILYNSVYLS